MYFWILIHKLWWLNLAKLEINSNKNCLLMNSFFFSERLFSPCFKQSPKRSSLFAKSTGSENFILVVSLSHIYLCFTYLQCLIKQADFSTSQVILLPLNSLCRIQEKQRSNSSIPLSMSIFTLKKDINFIKKRYLIWECSKIECLLCMLSVHKRRFKIDQERVILYC